MRWMILVWLFFYVQSAWSFPEMIRHGYTHCTACHVSPAGGGLLTAYGRVISKEILSRWSYEGEENLLHGAIQKESVLNWLNGSRENFGFNVGGDIRYMQHYVNNDVVERGRFFPMQRDLEVAMRWDDFVLVSTFGYRYAPTEPDEFETRRYYILYQPHDYVSLRAGRFLPIYGLMIADHYTFIKQGLQFNQGQERDNVEIHFIKDTWSASATYSQSPQSALRPLDTAVSIQLNYALADTHRLGVNYWRSESSLIQRSLFGLTGLFGFSHSFYALSEVDLQVSESSQTTKGLYYFQKVGYEFTRGLHLIGMINGTQTDLDDSNSKAVGYGAGISFYPRPHFEIQAQWNHIVAQMDQDMGFLIFHYYF